VTAESAQGSVTIVALFALAALATALLIGGLFRHLWAQAERRTIEKRQQERERRLVHCPVNSGPTLADISWVAWGNRKGIRKRDGDGPNRKHRSD
jgi:hypothetical protein